MEQFEAPVVDVETLTSGLSLVWLAGQPLARLTSGQFVMARCGDSIDPLLRKALSLHRRPRADGAVGFLFGTGKTWGRWLAARRPGDSVDVIAPLGKGFVRDKAASHLLLVGESLGISPLVALAEEGVAAGAAVTLVTSAGNVAGLYPLDRLPAEVEVIALTADGSAGRTGKALDVLPDLLAWADQAFLSGSSTLVDGVRNLLKLRQSSLAVQVIVEERMACGVGACLGCAVSTRHGMQPACTLGPVFDLKDLR